MAIAPDPVSPHRSVDARGRALPMTEEEIRRRAEAENARQEERIRLAAIPDDAKRIEFIRSVQLVLKRNGCYSGDLNGRSDETQVGLARFVENASKRGKTKPQRMELAKATVGDFEAWLKDANTFNGGLCAPPAASKPQAVPRPAKPEPPARQYAQPRQLPKAPVRQYQPRQSSPRPSGMGPIQGIQ